MYRTPRSHAFSLIELLVVISVIAVLAAMLIPAVSLVRAHANQLLCMSNQRQLGLALLTYAGDNDSLIPPVQVGKPDRDDLGLPYWGMWFGFIMNLLPANESAAIFRCPAGCFTLDETRAMGNNAYCSSYGLNGRPFGEPEPAWYALDLNLIRKPDLSIMLADHWGADNSGSAVADIYGTVDDPGHGGIVSGPRRPGIGAYSIRASHPNNTSTDPSKGRVVITCYSGRVECIRCQDSFVQGGGMNNWAPPNQWLGKY